MRGRALVTLPMVATAMMLLMGAAAPALAQPRERLEYWRTKYRELTPTDDPRVARAHAIFQRVVQVAGTRAGVVPRLLIVASEPWDLALPIALPDGGIILSKRALEVCYHEPARGDDRLAFMLAHELAHLLNDDFWHMRFFQAVEASRAKTPVAPEWLEELRRTASAAEHVLPRELQADERGIIYAAMAGFNTHAVVADDPRVNFFADWVRALDPRRLGGGAGDHLRPTPQERAEALKAHLRRVEHTTALFQAGLWFYYAGEYPRAVRAFEDFRAFFPGREVHHNLAASHHQLALQASQAGKQDLPALPFQLSLTVDPLTRASRIHLEGAATRRGAGGAPADPAAVLRHHLDQAVALYREALAQDASYTPAALNLGCALIVRGVHAQTRGLNADFAEAVTVLLRALERHPTAPELLNNLGVALWYADQPEQAKAHLTRARSAAPADPAPGFNLGQIARMERGDAATRPDGPADEPGAPRPTPGPPTAAARPERVLGLAVGDLDDRIPQSWGPAAPRAFPLEGRRMAVATYPAGLMTLSQDGEVRMIQVREGFRGASARGVTIGSAAQDVLAQYGAPSRRVELTPGQSWAYDAHRLAFQLRDGRVVSWLVF